jgi:hypothetical protein
VRSHRPTPRLCGPAFRRNRRQSRLRGSRCPWYRLGGAGLDPNVIAADRLPPARFLSR